MPDPILECEEDTRPSWDSIWLAVAGVMGRRSRCVRAQIGAVIVSANGRIASTGYNGPAASWPEKGDCSNFCPRAQGRTDIGLNYDLCPAIHSEANALVYVDRSQVEGGTIYVSSATCMSCAKLISNSGLARLHHRVLPSDSHRQPEIVENYLRRCGIDVTRAPLGTWDDCYRQGWTDASHTIALEMGSQMGKGGFFDAIKVAEMIGREADAHV